MARLCPSLCARFLRALVLLVLVSAASAADVPLFRRTGQPGVGATRMGLTSTSVGPLAFFAGSGDTTSTIDVYDASADSWSTAALSVARRYMAATAVGPIALFGGGDLSTSVLSSMPPAEGGPPPD
jgi:hypothetical protein